MPPRKKKSKNDITPRADKTLQKEADVLGDPFTSNGPLEATQDAVDSHDLETRIVIL